MLSTTPLQFASPGTALLRPRTSTGTRRLSLDPSPNWSVVFWGLDAVDRKTQVFKKKDVKPGMNVGDTVHMGGEVWNEWRSDPQPPQYLNDMGRTGYSRYHYLYRNPTTGQTAWKNLVKGQSILVDVLIDLNNNQTYKPPQRWVRRYKLVANVRQFDAGSTRPFAVEGYNGLPMAGTDRPCTCGDGNVFCNPDPPPSPEGPGWPWP